MSCNKFLVELCANEVERYVAMLFEKLPAGELTETPLIGGPCLPWWTGAIQQQQVLAALRAVEHHRSTVPAKYQPLPIREAVIERFENSADHRMNLLGLFGFSLRQQGWGDHPSFDRFCSGLMFDKRTPATLREDPELLAEFRPRKLKGLYRTCWYDEDYIAAFRPHVAMYDSNPAFQAFLLES